MKICEIMDHERLAYDQANMWGYRYGIPDDFKPAAYVWHQIKLAYREAKKQNKKVILTPTGYYKLADLDDPATEVIPNPNLDKLKEIILYEISKLKAIRKDRDQVMKLGGYNKVDAKLAKLNNELKSIPRHVEVK